MSFFEKISKDLMASMKAKDAPRTRTLQGIKAAMLVLKTQEGRKGEPTDDEYLKAMQKMAKQRKDSLEIFEKQGREDLAKKEREELNILEEYLPKQMGEGEIKAVLEKIIADTGASGPSDVGKVMPLAMKEMGGKADGKTISSVLRTLLH
jgi:hypothetical protein